MHVAPSSNLVRPLLVLLCTMIVLAGSPVLAQVRDLDLPLRGIPAQLNRAYDSRDKCPGDFGIGWNQPGPELRANLHPGLFWSLDEQYFCVTPNGPKYPP